MAAFPVQGFDPPTAVDYGVVPTDNAFAGATDGQGMIVSLNKGEGALLIASAPMRFEKGLIELSVSARATSDKVQMALVGFASSVDGSLGYVNPIKTEVPVNKWGRMRFVYDSPTDAIIPGLQFVLPEDAPVSSGTVYVDNLSIKRWSLPTTTPVEMQADGTFDTINPMLLGLNKNSFLPTGETPGTVSLTDGMSGQGVRLELTPEQLAAHIVLFSIAPKMPTMLYGTVWVKRESADGGTLAFVITDGDQSLGYFLKTGHLPLGEWKQIQLAGNFEVSGKKIPPVAVVQLGGPGVNGSVVIDNLELCTVQVYPPPVKPVEPLQTIVIPLDLPPDAKPLEMVLIPAGTFLMGSPDNEPGRASDEGPQHEVTISKPFYLGKYEVTQAQWQAVMGTNPSYWNEDNLPVEQVSWDDCRAFIQKLNNTALSGGTFRLPTEAEREYACRARTTTAFYWGDDPNSTFIGAYAWYDQNAGGATQEVGLKKPNAWGLYDMSGNVWELCWDLYAAYPSAPQVDPRGSSDEFRPVIRGGGLGNSAGGCRSASRNWMRNEETNRRVGFRLVREYP